LGTMCTCKEIERRTHACKASKLGPVERWWTQNGKLGIIIQDPPPESGRRTHLLYFYLFVLHSVMCLKTCHFAAGFTIPRTSIFIFLVNTARDVVTVVLIFAKYLSVYLHIFTCTYRGTHTQEHMYNQYTRGMETTWHRSLVERGGRKALLERLSLRDLAHTHTQKKCQEKTDIHESKEKF